MNQPESIAAKLTVGQYMSREILGVHANWSLDQVCDFFIDNYISGAPVVSEKGELVGVVSVTDIVRHNSLRVHDVQADSTHDYYLRSLESAYAREEITALRIKTEQEATVEDIMTPMIFEVGEDTTIQEAADMMVKGHIHRIFVTKGKQVIGVITALDMLKVIRDL